MKNQNQEILHLRQSVSDLQKELKIKGVGEETMRKMYDQASEF